VSELPARTSPGTDLRDDMPVVSLMGTHGASPLWIDRYASQGHLGIPLLSEAFVQDIPMMWKLLSDLGVTVRDVSREPSTADRSSPEFSGFTGVFYVGNATSDRDASGRHVIPARDFVARYAVQTVFGVGGSFGNGMVVMALLFTRENLSRSIANRFLPLVRHLAEATQPLVSAGRLYPPPRAQ
jgi:hypothetical protein